jgi:hypothetical protein
MFHYYKIGLTVGLLVLPVLILSINNHFDSGKKTSLRFTLAVVLVWTYLLASRFIVYAVDLWLANAPEEIQAIYDGDGAKNVFALFFGWVPGVFLAFISWLLARDWLWLKVRVGKVGEITNA